MTFLELQNNTLTRVSRTSADARARVKTFLNERMRTLQTSLGLGRTRRGSVSLNTVAADSTLITTGIVKVETITLPALNRSLLEKSMDTLRRMDASNTSSGSPLFYAIEKVNARSLSLFFWPKPDAIYSLTIEGILVGTDMAADADVPGLPEDFHDILITGALITEYDRDNNDKQAESMERKFEIRKRELRYFIAKTNSLHSRSNDQEWPWWMTRII